jgi:hypothetical protein
MSLRMPKADGEAECAERAARELAARRVLAAHAACCRVTRSFRALEPLDEFEVLASAAYLHDVSYAPEVAGPASIRSTELGSSGTLSMSAWPA